MANQYPGPPPEEPGHNPLAKPSADNPYAAPQDGGPAAGYGYPQGGAPGAPGYGYPQAAQTPPGYGYPQQTPPPVAPAAAPGFPPGAPPQPAPVAVPGQAMQPAGMALSLGDIAVTGDTIMTPAGPMPLKGAVWTATDMSRTEEKIQTAGIVLAIVFFFFCLLGLLFLLMKERTTTGFVQVTVNSGGRHHSTMIPVQSPEQVMFVINQVNYARSLSV
ncbi:hypothetical protein ACIRPT_14300 [Streptomyces sp. NPDC101227]|uniref:hypothetical protein n=1 Tax=Streptomyces sp. NPDC101227 TaxID=3366136 RepID=UPI0037F165E6